MEIADDVPGVLSEVLGWEALADDWDETAGLLEQMLAAVLSGDTEAARDACFRLEDDSPFRVATLGTGPLTPVPPRVRELVNRLIHTLDGNAAAGLPPLAVAGLSGVSAVSAVSAVPADAGVEEPELAVHLLAPLDGPRADEAYRQIRMLWSACADRFGPVEPVTGAPTSAALPGELATLPATSLIAAVKNADAGFQGVVRREHDLLCLSVALAANGTGWAGLDRAWETVAVDRTWALLAEARLYLGKRAAGEAEGEGFVVSELDAQDDGRAGRRITVLGAADRDAELSTWTWSRGDFAMPPFGRYLMHAAKIRYQLRIRDDTEPVSDLCGRVDDGIRELQQLGRDPESSAGAVEQLRVDGSLVAEVASRMRDMSRTVSIALKNMASLVHSDGNPDVTEDGLFRDDTQVGEWLLRQLDEDAGYLGEAAERAGRALASWAEEGSGTGFRGSAGVGAGVRSAGRDAGREAYRGAVRDTPTFGLITALPEEFAAMQMLMADPVRRAVPGDRSDYVVGTIPSLLPEEPHRVVLTMLGDTANADAASACARLISSFDGVDQVVMVGIAAGVPAPEDPARHVRVGDIVVASWGVVDYDHVVERLDGPELRQPFPRPSSLLATKAKMLEARELVGERPWEEWIDVAGSAPGFERPTAEDVLYSADDPDLRIAHPDPVLSGHRPGRPKVHYGRVGSADRSMRNAVLRDTLARRYQLRALEMEGQGVGSASFAAGVDWFMVRGISDYADAHMANGWRNYASAVAAAYVRALLAECPPIAPHGGHPRVVAGS